MNQQAGNRVQNRVATVETDPSRALEIVMAATSTDKYRAIDSYLEKSIRKIEELLPKELRGQAERFVKRAMLTFARKEELANVTQASFIRCVLEAAELGLSIDGRLAHAVKFSNKIKGTERYQDEAQLMIDYKGLVAVAKRSGLIKDVYARIVCEGDKYRAYDEDGDCKLFFEQDISPGRGRPIGAFAVVKLSGGQWRHEWMSIEELDAIKARSKSFKYKSGPWFTDEGEMQKKTIIRRVLKMYQDDPAISLALEYDRDDLEDVELGPSRTQVVGKLEDVLPAGPPIGKSQPTPRAKPLPTKVEPVPEPEPEATPADDLRPEPLQPEPAADQADQELTDRVNHHLLNNFRLPERKKALAAVNAKDGGPYTVTQALTLLGEL